MHVVLIYCRPSGETHTQTLRPWLEQQAAKLSAQPHVQRTAVVNLTTHGSDRGDRGWLLECELDDDAGAPGDMLRELLTDMRLVGFHPIVFTAPDAWIPAAVRLQYWLGTVCS
jgi:hypothetical protein